MTAMKKKYNRPNTFVLPAPYLLQAGMETGSPTSGHAGKEARSKQADFTTDDEEDFTMAKWSDDNMFDNWKN